MTNGRMERLSEPPAVSRHSALRADLHAALDSAGIGGVTRRKALYAGIKIATPDCLAINHALLALYKQNQARRTMLEKVKLAGRPMPLADGSILAITGPSHVGKSEAVKIFQTQILPVAKVHRGSKPMVYTSLNGGANVKSMWGAVLDELGDPHSVGTRITLENRILSLTAHHGTEIVAIDEAQHLTARTRSSPMLADSLKRMIQRGGFSLVLIGLAEEIDAMLHDDQIVNRLFDVIHLEATNVGDKAGRAKFKEFLDELDDQMVELGVFQERSDLTAPDTIAALFSGSNGLNGVAYRIVEHAIASAPQDATRLLPGDVAVAVAKRHRLRPIR